MANVSGALDRVIPGQLNNPKAGGNNPSVILLIQDEEFPNVEEYSITQDILNLGDACSCTIPNIEGENTGKIQLGNSLKFYIQDQHVNGGQKVLLLTGLVVGIKNVSDRNGDKLQIIGADLGWHLQKNSGPLWFNLKGVTYEQLVNTLLLTKNTRLAPFDPTGWNIKGLLKDNFSNRIRKTGLNQGRAGRLQNTPEQRKLYADVLPKIQIEPGQSIADILILYAKRVEALVNMTSDGYLQIFQPNYTQLTAYTFHYHTSDDRAKTKNNIISAELTQNAEGALTDTTCLGTVVQPRYNQSNDPNAGHFKGKFHDGQAFPVFHGQTFSDSDALGPKMADTRARWKAQRAQFDSWQYKIVVQGHRQQDILFAPDTLADISDDINQVNGSYYLRSVTFSRSRTEGTRSTLIYHKKNLLAV